MGVVHDRANTAFPGMGTEGGDPHFGGLTNSFDDFKAWIRWFPAGTSFEIDALPGNAPLTEAEVEARSDLGALMRKLKLKIVNVLPYDKYRRCKDSHSDSQKSSF